MIDWLIWIFISFPLTFGAYLSVMHLKAARHDGRLTLAAKIFGYPWLAFALVVDVLFNVVTGSLIFLERPREWLFTARVSRLNDNLDWRGRVARWFCRELLDPFDPSGKHCH